MKISASLCRIAPFALYMAFVGLEEVLRFFSARGVLPLAPGFYQGLYPIKVISVAVLLILFRKRYDEVSFRDLARPLTALVTLAAGMGVFAFWIRLDLPWASIGSSAGFNPNIFHDQGTMIFMTAARLCGAVLVVPVMEELFWRSFLIRYIISPDFTKVAVGSFAWPSFLLTSLLFGLEHNLFVAGIMAGIVYNLLIYYTRSLSSCIVAHAVTNLLLGIYVLNTATWHFW
jgi:CAAX prenyl protease-like protein